MKAIIKTVGRKKIIGINVEKNKNQLEEIAKMSDCEFEMISSDCGEYTLGEISEGTDNFHNESHKEIEDEILLFSGLGGRNLDRILNMLRVNGVSVPLKAVVTQYNRDWTLEKLRDEIKKEHELLNQNDSDGSDGGIQNG